VPTNEDGEFELILGNKQLLGMFFVVVVLLGVFFVMGYLVGQKSAPLAIADNSRKPDTKPLVVESPAPKQADQTAPEASVTPSAAPVTTAPQAPEAPPEQTPVETPKAAPTPKPASKAATAKSQPAKPEPAKSTKASAEPETQEPVTGGTYVQLVATTKHDADAMVQVLRKNGFPAIDNEVPGKPGLFRVLVGPTTEYNKLKDDLQKKGFEGDRAFKKQF